jgi:hypothetical protein
MVMILFNIYKAVKKIHVCVYKMLIITVSVLENLILNQDNSPFPTLYKSWQKDKKPT